jgi:hypothetical protein
MTEQLEQMCPYCKKPVYFIWNNGVVPSDEHVLIADWIYHTECWDKEVEEHPL